MTTDHTVTGTYFARRCWLSCTCGWKSDTPAFLDASGEPVSAFAADVINDHRRETNR